MKVSELAIWTDGIIRTVRDEERKVFPELFYQFGRRYFVICEPHNKREIGKKESGDRARNSFFLLAVKNDVLKIGKARNGHHKPVMILLGKGAEEVRMGWTGR